MGRSVTVPSPSLAQQPVTVHSERLNRDFRVFSDSTGLYESESETKDGQRVFEAKHKIEYVIGSGENGMSFVVQRGSYLFQAPLSFYTRTGKWDLSPGFAQSGSAQSDIGFNRPIFAACITCHSGRPQPVPDREGLFREPPFNELAIGCENCHGPGELHVAERAKGARRIPDNSIVNPARLPLRLAEDICLKCHQGGDTRALLPAKNYADFRPGTPLLDTVAVAALPLSASNTDLLEHHVSMKLSRCYRASAGRLSCLTCHDPHVEPAPSAAPEYYRSRCYNCHTDRSCRVSSTIRAQNGNNCIACHMPKRSVEQVAHAALTNHRIPLKPDAQPRDLSLPESAVAELPGLLLLDPTGHNQPLPLVTRLSLYGELSGRSPALLAQYLSLLDEAAKASPDNPAVLAALGRRSLFDKRPDALALLTKAASVDLPNEAVFVDYSKALDDAGLSKKSCAQLERAATLFPYSKEIRKRVILHYIQLQRYEEARSAMNRYVADFPEDDFIRSLLARVSNTP